MINRNIPVIRSRGQSLEASHIHFGLIDRIRKERSMARQIGTSVHAFGKYGIKLIVLTPNFTKKCPIHRIYRPSLRFINSTSYTIPPFPAR